MYSKKPAMLAVALLVLPFAEGNTDSASWYSLDGFSVATRGSLVIEPQAFDSEHGYNDSIAGALWIGEAEDAEWAPGTLGAPGVTIHLIHSQARFDLQANEWFQIPDPTWPVQAEDAALIQSLLAHRRLAGHSDFPREWLEPLQISIHQHAYLPDRDGYWINLDEGYPEFWSYVIDMHDSPGGFVRNLLVVPSMMGDAGRAEIESILDQISIEVAEAAG